MRVGTGEIKEEGGRMRGRKEWHGQKGERGGGEKMLGRWEGKTENLTLTICQNSTSSSHSNSSSTSDGRISQIFLFSIRFEPENRDSISDFFPSHC